MAWLVREGEVLCSVEVARTRRARRRGLLGRDGIDGALWLSPARCVHTFGMRFPIDVVFLRRHDDDHFEVLRVLTMRRHRPGTPRWRASGVLEVAAGSAQRWGLRVGETVELRG